MRKSPEDTNWEKPTGFGVGAVQVGLLELLVMLSIAVVAGLVGEALTPGDIPFRWAAAILMGVMGGIVGTALLGGWGPRLGVVYPFPATLGTAVFVTLFELSLGGVVLKSTSR